MFENMAYAVSLHYHSRVYMRKPSGQFFSNLTMSTFSKRHISLIRNKTQAGKLSSVFLSYFPLLKLNDNKTAYSIRIVQAKVRIKKV